ncbi:MAG: glycosyltransferase, partial [Nitrospira sp.]|nr:glycosyltransferase [Nitrospira sp.]
MATARVSVIIPTFNRVGVLCRAVESALNQTCPAFEIIVVDDGSTDDTSQVIPARFPSVRYHRIQHSGLPAVARNAGLRVAKGEYIAFLDSDDQWLPEKLVQQVAVLETNPAVGLACTNAFVIYKDDEIPIRPYLQDGQGQIGQVLNALLDNNFIIASTAVVRRSVLDQVGQFCEENSLLIGEDYDLWLRVAGVSEVHYIPKALAIYRDDPSISVRKNVTSSMNVQARLYILKRLRRFLKNNQATDLLPEGLLHSYETTAIRECCRVFRSNRQYGDFAKYTWRLFLREPVPVGNAILRRIGKAFLGKSTGHKSTRQSQGRNQEQSIADSGTMTGSLKLHLGCGEMYLPGYVNIDFHPAQHSIQQISKADMYADITQLRYSDATVDEIRLHHVFEHFERPVALRLLIEWYAWLKEDGTLIIETPDFHRCVQEYLNSVVFSDRMTILRHLFGSHEAKWAVHCDGW